MAFKPFNYTEYLLYKSLNFDIYEILLFAQIYNFKNILEYTQKGFISISMMKKENRCVYNKIFMNTLSQ